MKNFAERIYTAMDNQLNEITLNGGTQTAQLKDSIKVAKKAMAKLKNYISSYAFENTEEEIEFFKITKPLFYSKYIYFINVYNFMMQKPPGGDDVLRTYINHELTDLKRFFDHNHSFYQYYRSGSTQMDEIYFTRGGFDVHVELEDFEEDELYSTSHDYKLSKIIANEKFQDYLILELERLNKSADTADVTVHLALIWTANKTDLVELIYALVAAGVFNNGNVDIKTVVLFFQTSLQVDLGAYYHKWSDITRRKKEQAPFLDKLKVGLIRRIEYQIEPPVNGHAFNKPD